MKKITKRALSLTLALLLIVGLVVCGGSTVAAKATEEKVTLNWAVWDTNMTTYYQPLIDAYTAKNPNVTIEMVDLGSSDYQNALITQLTGGADLDVVCVKDIPGYANLVKGGYLVPMDDVGVDTSAYGGTIEQITVGGSFYALPFRSDHWVVFYNKDLFDAAGVAYPTNDMTFEEYDALARQMTSGHWRRQGLWQPLPHLALRCFSVLHPGRQAYGRRRQL